MRIGVDARNLVPKLSGIGRYVLEMCRVLSEQGHELILYSPERPINDLSAITGSDVRIFDYVGPWKRAYWSMTALPQSINKDSLDVFWGPAHRIPPGLNTYLPRVVTIHDLVWRKSAETMRLQTWMGERLFMNPAITRAQHIVTVSQATADDVMSFRPDAAGRITIIPPGLTKLPTPVTSPLLNLQPYALFVGTLEPRKNLARILEAFASLRPDTVEDLKLVIAGGQGWKLADLDSLINLHGLNGRVIATGYVSDAELAGLYSSARFLVMPSLYEGFGFPIIEANSFGIPVITSQISSMPEAAGNSALLIDPYDSGSIAQAILRLTRDKKLHATLASFARENAARFSWVEAGKTLLAVMQDLTNRR